VTWSVSRTSDEAKVNISDYEGSLAGGNIEIRLRKIDGKWIVVKRVFGGVA
jgi:hypothetical protein